MGACLRHNGDIDYLDILRDTPFGQFYVQRWSQSDGGCTDNDMAASPSLGIFSYANSSLHLYVDISKFNYEHLLFHDQLRLLQILMSVILAKITVQNMLHVLILWGPRKVFSVFVMLGTLELALIALVSQ